MDLQTESIWEHTSEEATSFPVFEGTRNIDVAIVGGGITGLTAAMLLSNAGKRVILLEAKKIGLGTTGNSTGNLYVTVDEHLSGIKQKWNIDVMKAVVESRSAAIDLIETTIRQYDIDCNFARLPFTLFAENSSDEIETFIQQEFEAYQEAGLRPKILDDARIPYKTVKALQIDGQAQFHPLKYVQQLAKAISSKCEIYENSRVIDIDDKEGILKTGKGILHANKILLATHTPIGFYMVQTLLGPYREFGVAAELNETVFPRGIYWGLDQPKHSIRSYSENGKNYIMVIGDKFKTGQHGNTKKYVAELEYYLKERFNVLETKFVWAGQQYRPADGLPYIGKHGERIYFMTGFTSDGLTYGTLAAMIVSDQLLEKTNPWEEIYKTGRFTPVKSASDFITENANVFVQYIKEIPDEDKSISEINPGEGKVIELNGQKLAVYKDENGHPHIVSAVCTHLKCIVNWNQTEKTWDCPCHGSRFDTEGKVIEGPAFHPLPGKKKTI